MIAGNEILMPVIGRAKDVALALGVNIKTVTNLRSCGLFRPGICIEDGKYNMAKLHECITTPPFRYTIKARNANYCRDLQT